MSLLRLASARHLTRHPAQLALSVLGVALGVAVVLSIDLAIQSSREAFRVSTETVAGRATHHLVGGPAGIADSVFTFVRVAAGVRRAAPVVEGWVGVDGLPGRAFRVLGIDPFSERPFRPYLAGGSPRVDATRLLTARGIVVAEGTARELGVGVGDPVTVTVDAGRWRVEVVGILTPEDALAREGLRDVLVADVGFAQTLLGRWGRLSRIDLAMPPGPDGAAAVDRLVAGLPPDVQIQETGARARTMTDMIRAFDLNLTALSLLALVFGMFLIYNAQTFSVVRRRGLLGTLRTLGVTRGEVFSLVLAEAAVLGVVGALVGAGLGVILGRGLVHLVTRTINDLYFVVSVEGLRVPTLLLLKAMALGVGATVLASLPPAREATGAVPRAALIRSVVEERWRRLVPRSAVAGVLLMAVGGVVLAVSDGVLGGFGALFAAILGMALLAPMLTVGLMGLARPVAQRAMGILGAMAARGVVTALSRTAPAIAALMVAVSVTVGLGVMISSFRGTVVRWLDQTLQADVYVSPPSRVSSRADGRLDGDLVASLLEAPGVAGGSTYRGTDILTEYGEVRLLAVALHPLGEAAYDLARGSPAEAFRAFRQGRGVLVSEPLAYRWGLSVGDSVRLPTELGARDLPVVGVYHDYGSDRGVVTVPRVLYDRLWTDPEVTSLGLFLAPGADGEAVMAGLRQVVADVAGAAGDAVIIRSNRQLRDGSVRVFDRTFAITGVLRALAFAVAFIGVLAALMALELERGRELAVLRANGMTPRQVWALVTAQTGLMGAVAGLLAVPAGTLLAAIMIFVVNRRSFGWTLRMEMGLEVPAQAVALALAGALLAGLYPAWKMARTRPSDALRTE
ncbi:MAG TPA: FtsX-like permease family protein [Longimicrobiales bacterium]